MTISTLARFEQKVQKFDPIISDCHEWTAYKNEFGYGTFRSGGKKELAHRAAYELYIGPIPPGVCVFHTCENHDCVNPAHLFLNSTQAPCGESHYHAKLTEQQVLAIRADTTRTNTALGRIYGVGQSQISKIKLRQKWKHLK